MFVNYIRQVSAKVFRPDLHFSVNECEVQGIFVNFDRNKSHINVIFVGGARCIDRVVKFATLKNLLLIATTVFRKVKHTVWKENV